MATICWDSQDLILIESQRREENLQLAARDVLDAHHQAERPGFCERYA